MNYVCGFVFNEGMTEVLLIKKARPEWQAGLLNGVGGKQEKDERRARDTMARECREETGLDIAADKWRMFAELLCPMDATRVIFFFAKIAFDGQWFKADGDEHARPFLCDDLESRDALPDVRWLVSLARNFDRAAAGDPHVMDHVVVMKRKS